MSDDAKRKKDDPAREGEDPTVETGAAAGDSEELEVAETEVIEPVFIEDEDEIRPVESGSQTPPHEEGGLPTSDPVFPTAIPPFKNPSGEPGEASPVGSKPSDPATTAGPAAAAAAASERVEPATVPPAPTTAQARGSYGGAVRPPAPRPQRSAAEIRADIERQRTELSQSVEVLRDKVNELTDWRGQVRKHRREITIGAAAIGFAVGAAVMLGRRRRRRL